MYLLMFVVQQFSSRETTRASCLIVMSQYKQTIQSDKIFFQRIATELTSIKCRFSVSVLNLEIDSFRYQLVSPIDSQQLSQSEGRICNSPRSWFVLIPDSRRRFEELQPIVGQTFTTLSLRIDGQKLSSINPLHGSGHLGQSVCTQARLSPVTVLNKIVCRQPQNKTLGRPTGL